MPCYKVNLKPEIVDNIIRFRNASLNESRTSNANCKLTKTQLKSIQLICKENGISMSRFIYEALLFYIDLFPFRDAMHKHRRWLRESVSLISDAEKTDRYYR